MSVEIGKAEEERALAIHQKAIVIDLHSDTMIDVVERRSVGERAVIEKRHLAKMRLGGITARNFSCGGDSTMFATFPLRSLPFGGTDPLKRALKLIDALHLESEESRNMISLATSAEDIEKAKIEEKIALMLSLEGGKPFENDLSLLRTFYRLGVRIVQLTWNFRNLLGDSAVERSNAGLTNLGVEAVEAMNKLGIVIDVSHLSEAGFWDILETSKDPVVASHSNARSLADHPRNLSDEQIKALAEGGGVMGMNAYRDFVSVGSNPTLQHLLDHVDHIAELVGVDHIGVGLDITEDWAEDLYQSIWSYKPEYISGLTSISNIPNLTKGLVARGYSDQEIEKILGGNFLRLFKSIFEK